MPIFIPKVNAAMVGTYDIRVEFLHLPLYNAEPEKRLSTVEGERRSQVGAGDRTEKIRIYNFPQIRVNDYCIGLTIYKLGSVMNCYLDEIIDVTITADTVTKTACYHDVF